VIRFLEARFGVMEPQISPWRRAVCGDLTSMFDFKTPNAAPAALPDASGLPPRAAKAKLTLPIPVVPMTPEALPRQEPGQRPARPLPYRFEASGEVGPRGFVLALSNPGPVGAHFELRPAFGGEPRFYAAAAKTNIEDLVPVEGRYDLSLYGPNGFLRGFRGEAGASGPEVSARFDPKAGGLVVTVRNRGDKPRTLDIRPNAYLQAAPRLHRLAPGEAVTDVWSLSASHNWYDFVVTCAEAPSFQRRLAGHGEDGKPSLSDPLVGRQA
jgi:phospholipase C